MSGGSVKVGIAGAGGIARRIHAPGWHKAGAEVVALYDTNAEAAEATAAAIEQNTGARPKVYGEMDALLGHPGLAVVDICSANAGHAPLTAQAIQAGKHVVVEKPFADTYEAAKEAHAAWKKAGSLFALGVNNNLETRWFRTMHHIVAQAREIGNIYSVDAIWEREQGVPLRGSGFTRAEIAGGGAGIDLGAHLVGMVNRILGGSRLIETMAHTLDYADLEIPVDGVYGGGAVVGDGHCDVDVALDGRLRFEAPAFNTAAGNVTVNINASWVRPGADKERMYFRVEGTKGAIAYERIWQIPDDDSTATWRMTQNVSRRDIPGVHSCVNQIVWNRNNSPFMHDPIMGREVVMEVMVKLLAGATIDELRRQGYAAATLDEHLQTQLVLHNLYASAKAKKAIPAI
jgi:predicted dehydrogenase